MNKKIKLRWTALNFKEEAYFSTDEIIRVEQNEMYAMVHIEQSAVEKYRATNIIPLKKSCKAMEEYLPKHTFCKTNRSNIINMDKILKVVKTYPTARVHMVNGSVIPVAKSHMKYFFYKWNELKTG